ncbi:MAG TPA: hypothetical protein VF383_13580 [Candidatus Dormibacteraeota bacterium]
MQDAGFTDRDLWVQIDSSHGQSSFQGSNPTSWTQAPLHVLWVLDATSSVIEAPMGSSITSLHGFPFVATDVSNNSSPLRLSWRDSRLSDSKDARLFLGGILLGIFGGLLTTILFAAAVGVDARISGGQ